MELITFTKQGHKSSSNLMGEPRTRSQMANSCIQHCCMADTGCRQFNRKTESGNPFSFTVLTGKHQVLSFDGYIWKLGLEHILGRIK